MKDWYLRQTPRDRVIVLVVGFLSLIGLFYAFVWHPMNTKIDDNLNSINTKQETLQKMEVASAKLKSLRGAGGAKPVVSDKEPYLLIDERIRAAKLDKPDRVAPVGSDGKGARVQFSEVEFDKLVLVLAELETYGLNVETLNVSRNPKLVGKVSARITMEKN